MSVADEVKAARMQRRTNVLTHAQTACPYRHVLSRAPGSRAAIVTRLSEVKSDLPKIKLTYFEVNLYVSAGMCVPRVATASA
jgi:hypothetical protein